MPDEPRGCDKVLGGLGRGDPCVARRRLPSRGGCGCSNSCEPELAHPSRLVRGQCPSLRLSAHRVGDFGLIEQELDRGFAPWEVRVECASRQEAADLAQQLEAEGYKPERRFQYLIVGAASREDADALAQRVHGEVEPGGELVYEVEPSNPFAIFGGMGM